MHTHVPGGPDKNPDIIVSLSVYHLYNSTYTGDLGQVTMDTLPAAMEKLEHVHAMCTRPLLLLSSKGLGTRLIVATDKRIVTVCKKLDL